MGQPHRPNLLGNALSRSLRWAVVGYTLLASLTLAPAIPPSAADEDTARSDAADGSQDAAIWRALRHRWWRDLPEAPDAPSVVAAGPDSLTVTWNAPDSATDIGSYGIEYRADDTPEFTSFDHADVATTTTLLNLTPSTPYHVRVRAVNDAGPGDWSPSGEGTTDNAAPYFVAGSATSRSLPENTPAGRDVGAPVAAMDAEGGALRYSLAGEDVASFDLDTASGQIRTREGVDYDHETRDEMALTVSVDDGNGGTASIDVAVEVADVDEPPGQPAAPAVAALSSTSLEVTWPEPANSGPPIDDYDLRYREAEIDGAFLDSDHVGTSRTATLGDLDPFTDYEVQVRAANTEGIGEWSTAERGRTLANAPPVFDEGESTRRSLAENTPSGVNIGTSITATDANGDTLTYALGEQGAALFSIHASNGQLLTAASAAFDHEKASSHEVIVSVDDIHGGRATIAVSIDVTDVDEPPERPTAPTAAAISGSTVRVTWSEPVNRGPPITDHDLRYRRSADGPTVDVGHDGTSTTAMIAGLTPSTTYEFEVRATNDEGVGDWSHSGAGTTLDNGAPVFDATADRHVAEDSPGGIDIGQPVRATDPDDHTLTYSLGGLDADLFTIDPATGQLATRADAYDHEELPLLEVTVAADDGHGGRSDTDVTIHVTDVDEPPGPPDAPTVSGSSSSSLEATWRQPSNDGPAIRDYDVQYRVANSGDAFEDAGHEGRSRSIAFTGLVPSAEYAVQVRASNAEGAGAWSPPGRGTTFENQSPTFDEGTTASRALAENAPEMLDVGEPVGATDADGDRLIYSLSGTHADLFAIDAGNGQLATAAGAAFDHESATTHQVTVAAADPHGGRASIDVTVNIVDVDEPPQAPAAPTVSEPSPTSLHVAWSAPANSGPPVDDYDVQYRVADGDDAFADAGHEGTGRSHTITGLEWSTEYAIQVRAGNEEGLGGWSNPGLGTTLANQAPTFDEGAEATRELAENAPGQTAVGGPLEATDADGDVLTFALSGSDAEMFTVDADGQLATATGAVFDHETHASHEVTVTVSDPHGGGASIDVTVAVTDVDEPPNRVATPVVRGVSASVVRVDWPRPGGDGPPIHDYDIQYRVANGGGAFAGVSHAGTGRRTYIRGLQPSTSYAAQVRAKNAEGPGDWSSSGTGETLENDAPVFDEGAETTREIPENSAGGQHVGNPVRATDPDDHTLTYVLGGPDAAAFTIATGTGQLATRHRAYDHEADPTLEVTVSADDGHGGRDDIEVTVRVTDVSEPPLAPAAPFVKAGGPDTLEVDWSAPANAGRPAITGYNVRYRSSGAFVVLPGTLSTTDAEIKDLEAGDYAVQVRAVNNEGVGAWSPSGHGSLNGNQPPVVDENLLPEVWVAVGGEDQLAPVGNAFSDPDGDRLTLNASSRDVSIATARMRGDSVSVHAVSEGSVEIDVSATDPTGGTASGAFKVSVAASPPAAPSLSLNNTQDVLTAVFPVSVGPMETRAYSARIRQKASRTTVRTYCFRLTNHSDERADLRATLRVVIGTFAAQGTTYLVDYRHSGADCSASPTSAWSATAEFTPVAPTTGGNFDIELVFADPEPSATVKSAFNAAADVWEQAITNDLTDIDYAAQPTSNPCTVGEFDGNVDDLRVLVLTQAIDGEGGTLATAGVCEIRRLSGLPIMAQVVLDSADAARISYSMARSVAVHELAHALGFGILWDDFLVDPSLAGGDPIDPPPDTHFDGSNAVDAFDDAGGTNYQGKKVPVENELGGSGSQDTHWRRSVMGSELMTYMLSSGSSPFSAITIQSMADLGYSVDDSVADNYTLPSMSEAMSVARQDRVGGLPLNCVVHPHIDVQTVPEPPVRLSPSAIQLEVNGDAPGSLITVW